MLTPEYLQSVPDGMIKLYAQAEAGILADMARRISTYDYWIPAVEHQAKMLEEAGLVREEILARLKTLTGRSNKELRQLMQEAGTVSLRSDDAVYRRQGLDPPPLAASEDLQKVLQAGYEKTAGTFSNLTRTTAATAAHQFEQALDRAYMQIALGGMDYGTAIRSAIKQLSAEGVGAIRYPSGRWDTIEVAVRRAVVTGINQTALKLQDARADEMGADLVEVSAHAGARPSHAAWQGGIYSRSGKSRKYPDFVKTTGYGTGAGLGGWNCSHSFRPWFEGMSRTYDKALLAEYQAKDYAYNGTKMTEYEALQEQRRLERNIRRWKREKNALDAAGLDSSDAAAGVRRWKGQYRDFLEQTGLKQDGMRLAVGQGSTPKEAERLKSLELKQREAYNKKQEEIRSLICSAEVNKAIHAGAQNKHIPSSKGYVEGRSYLFGDLKGAQALVDRYAGTGTAVLTRKGDWANKEIILSDEVIGAAIDLETGKAEETKKFVIHYGKRGAHIVPAKEG